MIKEKKRCQIIGEIAGMRSKDTEKDEHAKPERYVRQDSHLHANGTPQCKTLSQHKTGFSVQDRILSARQDQTGIVDHLPSHLQMLVLTTYHSCIIPLKPCAQGSDTGRLLCSITNKCIGFCAAARLADARPKTTQDGGQKYSRAGLARNKRHCP
eukprot:1161646-Pelagomonas_calceolata.AAC.24